MAHKIEMVEMDELSMSLSKAISCSFLMQFVDDIVHLPPGSDFSPDVVELTKGFLMEWQLAELRTIERVIDNLEPLNKNQKGGAVLVTSAAG